MKKIILSFLLLLPLLMLGQKKYTVSGYVHEKGSKESLLGVTVYVGEYQTGATTNAYGFYSVTLPEKDSITLIYSCVGFVADTITIDFRSNKSLNIELTQGISLQEVTVRAERINSEITQMSTVRLMPKEIKSIPMLLGEKDVFKTLMLLPGVSSGVEGTSGMYVRGGGPDQNLVILDEATIYNPSHLLGFFSIFNGDAIKSIELTKGGFPARYGGRLSSIIDVNMKEGNKQSYHGEGGIGILAAHAMVEGPIVKNKSSFMISARRTYFDILAQPIIAIANKGSDSKFNVGYFFFDLNAKLNYDFGDKNKLYVSGYWGKDKFYISDEYKGNVDNYSSYFKAGLYWQNGAAIARWNHLFSSKLFSNLSFIFSDYLMDIYNKEQIKENNIKDFYNMDYFSGIRDYTLKYDFTYTINPNHTLLMGATTTLHQFRPSAVVYADSDTTQNLSQGIQILGTEAAVYAEDEMRIGKKFKMNPGFRMALFSVRGKTYFSPEPRLSMSYNFLPNLAAKASYALMEQNIHLLSTSTIGLPTDLWVPSTNNILPQRSQQVALGLAYDLQKPKLSFSLEGYYKKMNNLIAYREGASFFFFDVIADGDFEDLIDPQTAKSGELIWEKNLTTGQGWSYGMEFLVRKTAGNFTGWIGYTLSWTMQQFDELNFGKKFYARYDRRHDVSVVLMYNIGKRISLSAAWVYATGNAVTIPESVYYYESMGQSIYNHFTQNHVRETNRILDPSARHWNTIETHGERNNFRMQPFHHLDIGIQIKTKPNRKWKWEGIWEISIYNVYNNKNAFFYNVDTETSWQYNEQTGETEMVDSRTVLKKICIFPIIPSISYNFKF